MKTIYTLYENGLTLGYHLL